MKTASSFFRPRHSHLRRALAGSVALLLGALIPAASAVDRTWAGSFSGLLFAPVWDAGLLPGFFFPAAVGAPTIADNVLFPAVIPPNSQLTPPVRDMRLDGSEIILSVAGGFPVAAANITFLNDYLLSQKNTANVAGEVPGPLFLGVGNVTVGGKHTAGIDADIFVFGQALTKLGSGTLLLQRTVFGNVVVSDGTLGGNFTVTGNFTNSAVFAPGNSPGTVRIQKDFLQTGSGTLRIEIASADVYDRVNVGGKAKLDGDLDVALLGRYRPKQGQKFDFLTANGGVHGSFDEVHTPAWGNLTLRAFYDDDRVYLKSVVASFAAAAETPNQAAVGQVLDEAIYDRRAEKLIHQLYKQDLNELPADLDKIAPEELTSVFTIGTSLATVQSLNIQRRTDDIRSGASGFSAGGLAVNGNAPGYSGSFGFGSGMAGPSGDDGKENKEVKSVVAPENRWGAFLSGTGEWVSVGNTDNARGYDLTSGGFTFGIDYKVTPNFAIGLMAGYTGTTADLTDRGRVYVNGGKLGLYATFFQNEQAAAPTMSKDSKEVAPPGPSIAKGFYADFAANGGYNSYDTRRSAFQGEAHGDTDGGELNVLFGIGYDCKAGGLTFGPTATFNYTYIGTNEFTETGSLAPLNVHGGKGESLRSAFGLKASYDWKVGGMIIKPEIRAAWQHEYGDVAYSLDSSFASGAGGNFTVNGPETGRDSLLLGAGFALQFNERMSTYFYYDGELGRERFERHAVSGGIRIAF